MDHGRQPEDRGEAVQAPPPGRADPVAQVVGQPEDGEPVAGDDAERGPKRPVEADEGDRDPGQAGVQVGVAEQGEAVQSDHRQRREGKRLVDRAEVALVRAAALGAHHQPYSDAGAGEQERGAAGGAAGDPEEVGGDVHAAAIPRWAPVAAITLASPSTGTRTPPKGSWLSALSGPESSADLARISASRAVGASAVAWTIPVKAGRPLAGSRIWWARPAPLPPQERRVMPLVATAPASISNSCSGTVPNGSSTRIRRRSPLDPPSLMSPQHSTAKALAPASASPTRSAIRPLAMPPPSIRTPGGRITVPASASTLTARHPEVALGPAGACSRAASSVRESGGGTAPSSEER